MGKKNQAYRLSSLCGTNPYQIQTLKIHCQNNLGQQVRQLNRVVALS